MSEKDEWQRLVETRKIAEYWIARCSRAEKQLEQRNWISVKDRLPEDEEANQPVVVLTESGDVGISRYRFFRGVEWDAFGYKITHWMPLPQKPESEVDVE